MKKLLFALVFFTLFTAVSLITNSKSVHAQVQECNETTVGQCIDNRECVIMGYTNGKPNYVFAANCGASAVFGRVQQPKGLFDYNVAGSGKGDGIGLISFISVLIRLATIIAGIFVMFNAIVAGWLYITSEGDAGAHVKVSEKLTYSVIGILIIVAAYTIAGILSLLLFGDALFILNPTVTTIQSNTAP